MTETLNTGKSATLNQNQTLNDNGINTANTTTQTLIHEEKNEFRNHEKNNVRKENLITFSQEPRLEESHVRNEKSK